VTDNLYRKYIERGRCSHMFCIACYQ